MNLQDLLHIFLQSRIAAGCRTSTVANYSRFLKAFYQSQHIESPDQLTYTALRDHLAALATRGLRGTTIEHRRVCIVTWLNWLHDEEHIALGEWNRHVRPVRCDRRQPRCLSQDECRRFLMTAECYPYKVPLVAKRNLAMLYMFLDTGLRLTELANLRVQDVDTQARTLTVQESKSRTFRKVKFSHQTLRKLRAYIRARGDRDSDLLWIPVGRNHPMSRQLVYRIVGDVARLAGLERVHPHALRHTFATLSLDNDIPVSSLQQLLGHARLETTMRYVHLRDDKALKDYDSASPVAMLDM